MVNRPLTCLAALAALAVLAPMSQAIVWAHTLTGGQSRTFGTTDARFGGVVIIDGNNGWGTGTFIGRGNGSAWFLTANHVIQPGVGGVVRYETGSGWAINQVIQVGTGDFSLVRVNSYNQNPIQLGLNTGPIVAGSSFVSAGYGGYGQQGQSPWNYSQKLHGMTSRISGTQVDTWAGYSGTTIIDTFDSPTSSNFTTIEGFGAPGDSGSAVINSNNEIMGVLSYGDFETYGGRNYYWALTQSNVASIYQTTGITPVPEPLTLAGLGLVALVAARRRKKG